MRSAARHSRCPRLVNREFRLRCSSSGGPCRKIDPHPPQVNRRRHCSLSGMSGHDRGRWRGSSRQAQHDGCQSGSQGPWVPPNFLRKSVPPTSASRRSAVLRGPDSRSATRLRARVLDQEDRSERSEEHTSELQSLMRISYAVFCLKKKKKQKKGTKHKST